MNIASCDFGFILGNMHETAEALPAVLDNDCNAVIEYFLRFGIFLTASSSR